MPVTQYKKVEKEFADRIGARLRRFWVSVGNFFKYIMVKGKQRFTVMLIPHSEKKIFNFQISFFTLIFVTFTLGLVLLGFFVLATHFTYTNEQNVKLTQERDVNEKTLTSLKDEISSIRTAGRHFKTSMDGVLSAIDSLDRPSATTATNANLIATSFPTFPEDSTPGAETVRELADLKSLTSLLGNSVQSLDSIGKVLAMYNDLLANTPTYWPLKGAQGIITTRFGWTTNPFTKVGYMHTGVDIAWGVGTPIVATADGTVMETAYSADLGYFVTIQHKYGFYTRYAHMSAFANKRKGDHVNRGDVIGYIGVTGLTTGPHLHYEVRLGSQYVNPMQFLSITPANLSVSVSGRSSD
ncbi:MAG TPA: M23 family metallopeptidase [Spirochaetia bacterium]